MLNPRDYKKNINNKTNYDGKIKVKLVLFIGITVTFLIFTQLVYAGNLAVDGQRLADIEEHIKILEDDNITLKVDIAKETSLATLSQKAQKLGYQKPEKIIEAN